MTGSGKKGDAGEGNESSKKTGESSKSDELFGEFLGLEIGLDCL